MKIKSVRARVYEWKGKTVPPQGNFCSNAMDLLYSPQETMSTFRFHGWTVVEVETDDGIVGLGNIGGEDIAVGTYTFFPSVAVDSLGNMAVGFAASGPVRGSFPTTVTRTARSPTSAPSGR